MRASLTLRKVAGLLVLAIGATIGCSHGGKPVAGSPRSGAAHVASVSYFEMSVLDLGNEQSFLSALDFHVSSGRQITGSAFADLVGLPGASARQLTLALGQQKLIVTQFLVPKGRAVEVARANDAGFEHIAIVVRNMDVAYARLGAAQMRPVSAEPQALPRTNPVAGGIRAAYFRDPDGHFMELLEFPPDKGDAVWHRDAKQMFLGIDHSAIAVGNTPRSLRFYRDVLGMHVVSESLNEGREQELLSGVAGARVKITSLHGASGPGIELLEYVAPRDGKEFPWATAADSVHWEVGLEVPSVEDALRSIRDAGLGSAPDHSVDVSTILPKIARAALVRDPDGHTVRIFEREPSEH